MDDIIRRVLKLHGRLDVDASSVGINDDLYDRGMTSHAVVNVMIDLEEELDFEFPDRLLVKGTFQTIGNLRAALTEIGVRADA